LKPDRGSGPTELAAWPLEQVLCLERLEGDRVDDRDQLPAEVESWIRFCGRVSATAIESLLFETILGTFETIWRLFEKILFYFETNLLMFFEKILRTIFAVLR
jgi:hypothetical protein